MTIFRAHAEGGRIARHAGDDRQQGSCPTSDTLLCQCTDCYLLPWCLQQTRETLLSLLAFCAALTIDAVIVKNSDSKQRIEYSHQLADAMTFDMNEWFTPTAENYFSKILKAAILAAFKEAGVSTAPAWEKAKKAELAAIAEREIAATDWLPETVAFSGRRRRRGAEGCSIASLSRRSVGAQPAGRFSDGQASDALDPGPIS